MAEAAFIQVDLSAGVGLSDEARKAVIQSDLNGGVGLGDAARKAAIQVDVGVLVPGAQLSIQADVNLLVVVQPSHDGLLQSDVYVPAAKPHAFIQSDVEPTRPFAPVPDGFIQADLNSQDVTLTVADGIIQADVNIPILYAGGSGNMPIGPGLGERVPPEPSEPVGIVDEEGNVLVDENGDTLIFG